MLEALKAFHESARRAVMSPADREMADALERPAPRSHYQIISDEIAALEAAGMLDRPDYANSLIPENPKDI